MLSTTKHLVAQVFAENDRPVAWTQQSMGFDLSSPKQPRVGSSHSWVEVQHVPDHFLVCQTRIGIIRQHGKHLVDESILAAGAVVADVQLEGFPG